jgi:dipeptidase D
MKKSSQPTVLATRVMVIFTEIVKLKRPSGAENELREYIIKFIQNLQNPTIRIIHYQPDATAPGERVIVVRKAAQGSGRAEVKMVLQAHLDMVCNPSDMTFPLSTYIVEDRNVQWLKGRSHDGRPSTLGADDGIGVATMLAILEDTTIAAGQLEFVFTVQEETDMGGAEQFDPRLLEGRLYINLDSEDERLITYGSAGGMKSSITFTPNYVPLPGAGTALVRLGITGLSGGHSGTNIHEGRANAIQLMARILFDLSAHAATADHNGSNDSFAFHLVTINTTNRATNIIPMDVTAVIALKQEDWERFQIAFARLGAALKSEYGTTDPNLTYQAEVLDVSETKDMLDAQYTGKLLNLLVALPHGALRMEPKTAALSQDIVQTSSNLAIVNRENGVVKIACSHRSSSVSQLSWVAAIHRALALANGCAVSNTNPYPAWMPNAASPLLQTARKIYAAHYGNDSYGKPRWQATIIHAGLECGWMVAKCQDSPRPMDCIAIGPTVLDAHTPNERLSINSVTDFCICLIGIIADLSL